MATPSLYPVYMLTEAGSTDILGALISATVGGADIVASLGSPVVAQLRSDGLRAVIGSAIPAIVPSGELRAIITSDDLNAEVK